MCSSHSFNIVSKASPDGLPCAFQSEPNQRLLALPVLGSRAWSRSRLQGGQGWETVGSLMDGL